MKQSEQTQANAPTTASAGTTDYVIKSGDTLGAIAAKFSTSIQNLKSLNGLKSDLIFAGQRLKVSGSAASNSSPFS